MLNEAFRSMDVKKKALDGSWMRNQLIANNLANVNTPGYKRQDVDFEKVLSDFLNQGGSQLVRTNPKHLPISGENPSDIQFAVTQDSGISYRKDENSVNPDVESAEEAKNQMYYNMVTSSLNGEIKRLRLAIREGR